jgi:hypothetical protein
MHDMNLEMHRAKIGVFVMVALCIFLVSCSEKKSASKQDKPKTQPSLHNAMFLEITPLSDGSAYAKSFDSGLWYLRSNQAVRVTITGSESANMPLLMEITPILDGGAYATSFETNFSLWYLQGSHAEKVTEVKSLADADERLKVSDRAIFALYLSERQKRKAAEARAEDMPYMDESSNDDPRY